MKKLSLLLFISSVVFIGCESEKVAPEFDCAQAAIVMSAVTSDVSCGSDDGSIELTASGGADPYTFTLNGVSNESGVFSGLKPGNYSVTVMDQNGCESSDSFVLKSTDGVNINSISTVPAECGTNNGSMSITAEDGTTPYTYFLDGNEVSSGSIENLGAGVYQVEVIDDAGCSAVQEVLVSTDISLTTDIIPIINQNCAVSGCHAGSRSPDLRVKANIISRAGQIRSLTQSGAMPKNGTLPQSEIDLIACWVDSGATDN